MPSSVHPIDSTGLASNRGVIRFSGLRAAAVLTAIGSMTLAAAGQDSYDGALGGDSDFDTPASWGGVYPGDDFGGNIIDILSIFGADPINVANGITGIGGLTNSNDLAVVFDGTGSFTFSDAAIINPEAGSFTFEIDVIASGSLTFDLTGGGLVQIDGDFTTNGGTILADGGFVDVNGATTSGEGTVWNANAGGFNFNGDFNATGAQTFAGTSGTVADDVFTFNDANFLNGVDPLTDIATFDAATVNFNGVTTVANDYGFTLDSAAAVTLNSFVALGDFSVTFEDSDSTFSVTGDASFIDNATFLIFGLGEGDANFSGEVTLGQTFSVFVGGADQSVTFSGETIFESDAVLNVGGNGAFNLAGTTELPGPFTLMVEDGSTANWTASTTLDGDFTVDTTGGAGDATVNFGTDGLTSGGGFSNAPGADDLLIDITTDGALDTVKFAGGFLRDFTGKINVNDNSAVTFEGGGAGGNGTVSLELNSSSTVELAGGTSGGTIAFDQLVGADDAGVISATGNENLTLSVKGGGSIADPETGLYMGGIVDSTTAGNNGTLSLIVTEGTFNYGGLATYTGNTTISNGGTFRIDGNGLTTGSVTDTDNLIINGGNLLLENSARLEGSGTVGLSAGSTIDITADAGNGANLQFDDDASVEGAITLSGDSFGAYNLIFGNSTVDSTTIQGSITASGNSGARFGGDVTVGRTGQLVLEDTARADIAGSMEVTGLVDLSGTAVDGLTVADGLDIGENGQVQLAGSRTLSVTGDSTVAANANGMLLDDDSAATFDGNLDNAGTISLNDNALLTVNNGDTTGGGNLTLSGTAMADLNGNAAFAIIQAEDTSMVDVEGDLDLTGNSTFAAGTTLNVGGLLDLADGAMLDLQGTDLDEMNLTADGGILVNSGATLMGNATINTSQLEYGGKVIVGATGSTTGLLTLDSGNLVSDTGGELTFGLTGDLIVGLGNGAYGQNSLINVASGTADFTDSGSIVLEVQGTTYIPTDREFTIIETSGGITGDTSVTTNRDQSITRGANNGAGGWATDADALSIWAQSSAQYTNTLSGPDFETGLMLDSFIPFANSDPGNTYGQLLGQLDQIDDAADYAAAVEGLGPTVQVSTIQLATNTQYFQVLRSEIRRRHATVKQRTPAPFRLSNGTDFISSQDEAAQAKIRRNVRQPSTAEGFGVFWGRDLDTPDEGDIAGISGNEYGGIGGFAWDLSDQWVAGVNLGYSQISGDVNGGFGSTRVGTVRGGGFVSWFDDGGLFFDVELAGAWNHYDFTRFVPNTGLDTDSTADGFQVDFSAGGGYRVELGESWAITPEASFLYSYVSTGDINEDTSSAAALSISPGDLSALVGRAGGTISWSALPGLVLDGSLGWQGNFNFNGDYEVGLTNQKADFKYVADDQTINTAYYGVGVNWNPTYNVNVSVQYEGRNGEGFSSNMLYGGVSIGF